MPLTADRAKPAVPFGGSYRLIDFALSNLVNAGYLQIVVLTQYKSHCLDRHISQTWRMSTLLGNYVTPVPAQQRLGKQWYLGSADAIYQSLNLINDERPDIVVVFGADHVYRMDFRADGRRAHRVRRRRARSPASGCRARTADQFGVIDVDADGPVADPRVPREAGRPARPAGQPRRGRSRRWATTSSTPTRWSRRVDARRRRDDGSQARHGRRHHPVLRRTRRGRASTTSSDNDVPGSTDRDRDYWRDVGTLDVVLRRAHGPGLAAAGLQPLQLEWPIYTSLRPQPPAKFVQGAAGQHRLRRRRDRLAGCRRLRRARSELGAVAGRARRRRRPRSPARC